MRKTALVFNRFLSLFLAFLLGFFSFGGLLVGAGYIAYNHLSVDFLSQFGIYVDTDQMFDKDKADVSVDSLTIKELVAEMQKLSEMGDKVTFNFLKDRYGLKLSDEISALLPEGARDLPITTIFGENGLYEVLDTIEVSYVLQFAPEDSLSDPLVYAIQDKTLAEVVDMDLGYLFADVDLGYLLGLEYVKNDDGEYELVVANPEQKTLQEIVAPIKLGSVLADAQAGELDILKVIDNNLAEVTLTEIFGAFDTVEIPTVFGVKTLGEILTMGEDGKYIIDTEKVTAGVYLGQIMGYKYDETDKHWYEDDGSEGDARVKAQALFEPICSTLLEEFIDPGEGRDAADVIMDSFRRENTQLGTVMGYMLDGNTWYINDGTVGDARTAVDHFFAPICNVFLADILDSSPDHTASDAIMESFRDSETKLGDMMGYIYDTDDGCWYLDNGATGEDRTAADALFGPLCDIMLYELIFHPDDKPAGDVFKEKFDSSDTRLGDVMGYTKVPNTDYDPLGDSNAYFWFDESGEITGVGATIADYKLSDVMNGGIDTDEIIEGISIAEVYGLQKGDKLPVYLLGSTVDISDKVDITVWYNKSNKQANSIISALANLKVSELESKLNELKISDVLDLVCYDNDTEDDIPERYYSWEIVVNGDEKYIVLTEDTSITAEFAGLDLDSLSNGGIESRIDQISIGKFLGYTQNANGEWVGANGVVDGILGIVAGATTKTLEKKINETRIGDIKGYICVKDSDGNDVWYVEYNSETDNVPATGLLATLAGLSVQDLTNEDLIRNRVQNVKLCDVLGYTLDSNGEYYKLVGGSKVYADGVMSSIMGSTVGNVEDEINNTPISKIAGYYYDENTQKFYTDKDFKNEAHGVLVSFADLTIGHITDPGEMTHRIQGITIADAFEYKQNPDTLKWHYTLSDGSMGSEVKGILGAIAGSKISDISDSIKAKQTGELLGYTYGSKKDASGNIIANEYWWYDDNGIAVSQLMNKIADTKFEDLDAVTHSLTIGDIISPEDRSSGYLSLIDPQTTLDDLPSALNDIFGTITIRQLYDAGVIKLDNGTLNDSIGNLTINKLISSSVN